MDFPYLAPREQKKSLVVDKHLNFRQYQCSPVYEGFPAELSCVRAEDREPSWFESGLKKRN
jgi:hypothetical protein